MMISGIWGAGAGLLLGRRGEKKVEEIAGLASAGRRSPTIFHAFLSPPRYHHTLTPGWRAGWDVGQCEREGEVDKRVEFDRWGGRLECKTLVNYHNISIGLQIPIN